MGRVGSCFDNAASESFHSTLEFELLRKHRFATKTEARAAVASWIDCYNRTRRHSSCEMKPPIEFEAILAAANGRTGPSGGGGVKTGLQDRLTATKRDRVAPDTGPMTGSSNNQQPSTLRGEAQRRQIA